MENLSPLVRTGQRYTLDGDELTLTRGNNDEPNNAALVHERYWAQKSDAVDSRDSDSRPW
jgi:hypothetical protein